MGTVKKFTPEKLIIGVLLGDGPARSIDPEKSIKPLLETHFGKADFISPRFPFTFTDYYTEEMGGVIEKLFYAFEKLVDPASLADIKLLTNRLETRFAVEGKRKVNLDPGILNLYRLILASTKNAPHRVPLSGGIYAEITLIYRNKTFQDLFWTYPDFKTESYKQILAEIRSLYKQQLKQQDE
jgi:hypothetical protein